MKIEIKNLNKTIKKVPIIKNVSYTFESGKIYGIYGRNGSGKSVFLKLIAGFYYPTSGSITLNNVDFNKNYSFLPNAGVLIERPSFIPDLTGFQNLKLLADIQKKISSDDILEFLKIVNLMDDKDKRYSKYSLGMKQKLGITQAIMENPDIIILDEPFNGVERNSVNDIINYLIKNKNEKIIIVSSHIKDDLKKMCDVIINIDDGKIV